MDKAQQIDARPGFPWLEAQDVRGVAAFLHERGWIAADERVVSCAKAGEGNMNLTLRVRTAAPHGRSAVLKQARPWVEKYPTIAAPWDRILFEQRFYERVGGIEGVGERMPRVLGAHAAARALLLEDLPGARDLTWLYDAKDEPTGTGGRERERADELQSNEIAALAGYLRRLHDATEGGGEERLANREMRRLNHEHIFGLPLRTREAGAPGDLDRHEVGLDAAAAGLKADAAYVEAVARTGRRYLSDGPCLVHGDYFPGSWMRTERGLCIIDPEFCYYSDREFDIGFAAAHLVLARRAGRVREFLNAYADAGRMGERGGAGGAGPPESGGCYDEALVARYASAEVMRRLIGVAQLPIAKTDDGWRGELLGRCRAAMLDQSLEPLCT